MASNALALFAIQRGIQTGSDAGSAFKQQMFAQLQAESIGNQMQEIEQRSRMAIANTWQKAEQVEAKQIAAIVSGGVELSGSSMANLSNTLNQAAQEAFIKRRETDYNKMILGIEQSQYEEMGSIENLLLNVGASAVSGYAGYQTDKQKYQSVRSSNYGRAAGIGE